MIVGVVGGSGGVVDDSGVGSVQFDFFSSVFRVRYLTETKSSIYNLNASV